ncbi:MAG: hypothetical protein MJE66_05305 [Proteobacteria bacterium]|nr:hypothetical protein [Pseudomonadota bacterium]
MPNLLKPRKGNRYRARRDLAVSGVITFGAPFTLGFDGVLPQGEVVAVDMDPPAWAGGVYLVPERTSHFEEQFVPQRDRDHEDYSSYAIAVSFEDLERDFEPLAAR